MFCYVIEAVDGTHTSEAFKTREAAVAAAKDWLGSTFNTIAEDSCWISKYGERVSIASADNF